MSMFFTNNRTYIEELGIKGGAQQGDEEEKDEETPTEEEPNPEGEDNTDTEEEPVPEEEPAPEGDTEEEPVPEDEETPAPEGDTEEEPVPEDNGEEPVPDEGGDGEPAPEGDTTGGGDSAPAPEGGSDGGSDLEEPAPDEGEDGEESPEGEEDVEGGDSDGDGEADSTDDNNIQAMEDEIFSGLTDAQKLIKISELKGSFSKLYRSCDMIFNKLDTIPKSDDNLLVMERITNTLSDLKQYIEHYLMYTFDTKSYLENETNLQKYISIFNAVREIFAQISKQKA